MTIYLIEKLWQDSLENRDAYGYEPIGYTTDPQSKELEKIIHPANGWPLIWPVPVFKVTELKELSIADIKIS